MSYDKSVSDHYTHGDLLSAIETALPALGKTAEDVTIGNRERSTVSPFSRYFLAFEFL